MTVAKPFALHTKTKRKIAIQAITKLFALVTKVTNLNHRESLTEEVTKGRFFKLVVLLITYKFFFLIELLEWNERNYI